MYNLREVHNFLLRPNVHNVALGTYLFAPLLPTRGPGRRGLDDSDMYFTLEDTGGVYNISVGVTESPYIGGTFM